MRMHVAILLIGLVACSEGLLEPEVLALAHVSGDNQEGTVGEPLAQPLTVRVTGAGGRSVSGVEVHFAAGLGAGTVAPLAVETGPDGLASTTFTLGPSAGPQDATAAILVPRSDTGFASVPVTFSATAASGPPATAIAVRGDQQRGCAGWELVMTFVARIEDRFGNPVPGVALAWSITEGGGTITVADATTNEAGEARARAALGSEPGVNAVEATAAGLAPIRYTATGMLCLATGSIAFESPHGLEVMEADGSGRTVFIPGTVADPAWSPDGTRLAFTLTSDDWESCSIYWAYADGSEARAVTPQVAGQCDHSPAWSPDGARIVFARTEPALAQVVGVIRDDGSDFVVLSSRAGATDPSWSPDGMKVAFIVTRRIRFVVAREIAVVNADGTGGVTVIRSRAFSPVWSPDGAQLAFVSGADIWLMNPDGSEATNLGLQDLSPGAVRWSPDGAEIVFSASTSGSPQDLYVIRRDGTGLRQLTRTDESESDPTWRR